MAHLKVFIIKLTVLSVVFLAVGFLILSGCFTQYYFTSFPFLICYFFILTLTSHFILLKIENLRFAKFSSYFMLITGIKMFMNILFIVIHVWFQRKTAFPFLISFILLYLGYTLFEVISLLIHYKKKNSPPTIIVH
ncbi:MAG: hypothetical protein HY958_05255 [Bacteroidia bacterium]|nr:hypothetical protein [Bacteroidia bacterium]